MGWITFLAVSAVLALGGCTAGAAETPPPSGETPPPSPSPTPPAPTSAPPAIVLNRSPADLGCDSIGWPDDVERFRSLTFRIDPAAAEQVMAVSDTGVELETSWAPGFEPGSATERVVRGPDGQVVARDGEVVDLPEAANPELHGYLLCLTPTTLDVMERRPSG
jgi:hypothetical protein